MEYRKLGRTGLEVGVIGLGTEYLIEVPRETVVSTVRAAVEAGVNYFDVLFAYPHYRDNFGAAFEGLRDDILIAGHLGCAETNGQYRLSRDLAECEDLIEDELRRLRTDHLDVIFLSNCDHDDDYDLVMSDDGLLGLARRLVQQGKARYIAFSGHEVPVAMRAVQSGEVDIIMHTISLAAGASPDRAGLYGACSARDLGLIGMKPFAGGVLLQDGQHPPLTPVQCLSYVAAQPGVTCALPGVKNVDELRQTLHYLEATPEERDFSAALPAFQEEQEGVCVYCNHCLPCPSEIDVGRTLRVLATARERGSGATAGLLDELPVKPTECIQCGECMERCPFGVDVISQMEELVRMFGE